MLTASRLRHGFPSGAMASAYSSYHGAGNASQQFTATALGRWSILNKQLPAVERINALHVYDFDNTLFRTPTPNPSVWNGPTIGKLSSQNLFATGGWWHDNRILAATGQGLDKEEPRAWEGWWNEKVVELVRLTIKQPDALCILLTGRSEEGFSSLIKRIISSKGLDFDLVCLKPQVSPSNQKFQSTMHFKQLFLNTLMETYKHATEIKIYEDRPKHTKGFRDFFTEYNRRQMVAPTRGPLLAEAFQVVDASGKLDPVVEVAEVQHMVNLHNEALPGLGQNSRQSRLKIKKSVFFTSYMISVEDAKKILAVAQLPPDLREQDIKLHANNILICPRPCPANILEKVGGLGAKMLWEVTGTACLDGSVWAARVRPVPSTTVYHTDNPVPLVVLALRRGARPVDAGRITEWDPLPESQSFVFETTVGEKVVLRIETEYPDEDEYASLFVSKAAKRKHVGEDDWMPRNTYGHYGGRNETRGLHYGGRGAGRGRGGSSGRGPRGNSRGGGRGTRGRAGFQNYRSLDDVDHKNAPGGYASQMEYEEAYHPPGQVQAVPRGPRASHGHGAMAQGRGGAQLPGRPAGVGQAISDADLQNFY
ncbi:hypothetical protein CDD83_2999 [Cordyceps sp. RAO-2017]|nr:hypothetical protein CDD83_2999 [Cordyceps sp. RAO-2017]